MQAVGMSVRSAVQPASREQKLRSIEPPWQPEILCNTSIPLKKNYIFST
jgi:hypothetical protein